MSLRDSWRTPRVFFEEQHAKHRFTVDVCAEPWNAQLPRYWATREWLSVEDYGDSHPPSAFDGLAQDWRHERVWCNPPYGRGLIEPWVNKALDEATYAVLLLPARTSTRWFQRLWEQQTLDYGSGVILEFLPKRLRFEPPADVTTSSPMEDNLLVWVRR